MEALEEWWFQSPTLFQNIQTYTQSNKKLGLHQQTNNIIEMCSLPFPENIIQEISVMEWRYKSEYPIFRILHIRPDNQSIIVYREGVKVLLKNLCSLALPQCLYIFKTTIFGIEKLVQKYGLFSITAKMIGITYENECKVWINERLQLNSVMGQCESEFQMVNTLLKILYSKVEISKKTELFFQQGFQRCNTFAQAINFVNLFTYEEQVLVPPIFTDIFKVIHHHRIKTYLDEDIFDKNLSKKPEKKSQTSSLFSQNMTIRNLSLRTTGLGLNRNNTTSSNFNGIMKSYSTFDSSFKNKSTIKYANYLKYEHSSELNKNKSQPLSFCKKPKAKLQHGKKKSSVATTIQSKKNNEKKMKKFVKDKIKRYMQFYNKFKSSKTIEDNSYILFEQLHDSLSDLQKLGKMGRKINDSILEDDSEDLK